MSTMKLADRQNVPLEKVTPYWRNPRRISDDAVNKLADALKRYGYRQPIVVDQNFVVIVGHTRLQAMTQLGVTDVAVIVADLPEDKAREYRIMDNRVSELTDWDDKALMTELREWEPDLLESYFPELQLEQDLVGQAIRDVTEKDMASAAEKVATVKDAGPQLTTQVCCPACKKDFPVVTDLLPGIDQHDLDALAAAADGRAE